MACDIIKLDHPDLLYLYAVVELQIMRSRIVAGKFCVNNNQAMLSIMARDGVSYGTRSCKNFPRTFLNAKIKITFRAKQVVNLLCVCLIV